MDQLGADTVFPMLSEVPVAESHCWSHNFCCFPEGRVIEVSLYISEKGAVRQQKIRRFLYACISGRPKIRIIAWTDSLSGS